MGESHIPAAADGSSEREPTGTLYLKLPFFARSFGFSRPDQLVCEALRYSTYSGLRKDGQVEGKVQGELRGVVRVCPLLQCVPALGANQMVVPHGKHFKCRFSSSCRIKLVHFLNT